MLSLLVGIIFLWFWSQGPLNKPNTQLNFVSNESEFLRPIFIQSDSNMSQKQFGLLAADQVKSGGVHDYQLVEKERKTNTHGLIADQHHQAAMVAVVGEEMQQRARLFYPIATTDLKSALDMFYIEIRNKVGRFTGLYLESRGITEHIKGYADAITLGISISSGGKVERVHYISSQETSSYLRQISNAGFYQQFEGLTLDGTQHQIDAVSGATISTDTMAKTITTLLNKATESPLSLYLDTDIAGTTIAAKLTNAWIFQIIFIAACFLYFWQRWFSRTRRRTTIVMLFSAVGLGFYLNNSFTYVSFLHPFLGVSVSVLVALYCALALLGSIWDNNTYCKFVCPYGNLQRLLVRLTPTLRRPLFLPARTISRARTVLTITLIIGIILGQKQWASYELFPDLFGLETASLWFVTALATIIIASIYPMIWCRLLCPTGEVLDWISQLTSSKHKAPPKTHVTACTTCSTGACHNKDKQP